MKVLLVHNFYRSQMPSGENQVFESEMALLEKNGHEVFAFTRHSDEIQSQGLLGSVRGAVVTPWSPFAAHSIRKALAALKPDVVHVHNTFPLISPSIFHAIGSRAARVLTLHNYRLLCAAAIPMRAGQVCTECIQRRSVIPAMKYGCYRGSRLATAPLAANIALHRSIGTWQNQVDAFITLSEFQRQQMIDGGLPAEKTYVKPNFYAGSPNVLPFSDRPGYVVFVGRLSDEKGVQTLLKAWAAWGASAPELRLVGDGPLRQSLEKQAQGLPVQFLGQVSAVEARAQIAAASLLVLPSQCYETFGLVLSEAFAFGTPCAVSDIGSLSNIVKHGVNGVVFRVADPASILDTIKSAWMQEGHLERLASRARFDFEKKYDEESNYEQLIEIYKSAIMRNQAKA